MGYVMIINSYIGGIVMENNEVKSINKVLRDISIEWLNSDNVKSWINAGGHDKIKDLRDYLRNKYKKEDYCISEPFFFGLPQEFLDNRNKPLIMVVGQETNSYGEIKNILIGDKNQEDRIGKSQNWVVEVTRYINGLKDDYQWENYDGKKQSIHIKSTPFFRFLSGLAENYNVCWNNLDKIHYATIANKIKKTVTLYSEDEKYLFQSKIKSTQKTLLESEIEIVKPDIVLFVTGPKYKKSMEYQIGKVFQGKPNTKENLIKAREKEYYWTYHPVYLSRIKMTDKVIEALNNLLPDKSNI